MLHRRCNCTFQPLSHRGHGFDHRTAQLFRKRLDVDVGLLFGVDIALVERHNHRNAQLEQLRGEKQAAAQVGRVDDIDNRVRALIAHIRAGDALFRGKRRHGVRAGQIDCDQLLRTAAIGFFDRMLFLFHRHTSPVAHFFVTPGQGVVHGGLAGVRVACQGNTHKYFLLFMVSLRIYYSTHQLALDNRYVG